MFGSRFAGRNRLFGLLVATLLHMAQVVDDEYYSEYELKKLAEAWNSVPIVVNHPTNDRGQFISANSEPGRKQRIGTLLGTYLDGKKLIGEAWLEKDRVQDVDLRIPRDNPPGLVEFAKEQAVPYESVVAAAITQMVADYVEAELAKKSRSKTPRKAKPRAL